MLTKTVIVSKKNYHTEVSFEFGQKYKFYYVFLSYKTEVSFECIENVHTSKKVTILSKLQICPRTALVVSISPLTMSTI